MIKHCYLLSEGQNTGNSILSVNFICNCITHLVIGEKKKLGLLTKASCYISPRHMLGSGNIVNQCNSIRKSAIRSVQRFTWYKTDVVHNS